MWKRCGLFLMSASVLFGVILVKQAHAENAPANPVRPPSMVQLYLDHGFMDRDVDLLLQDIGVRAVFGKHDIPFPGVFNIISESDSATGTANGEPYFGYAWRLAWVTNAVESPTSVRVTLTAPNCGSSGTKHCAIAETYKGKIRIIAPEEPTDGQATAVVRMGSVVRAVEIAGYMTQGDASWYSYKNCNCAASPDFAKGTYVLVTRLDNESKSVVVRINDWGPDRNKFPSRVIDLDKVAFAAIGNPRGGLMRVKVLPLAPDDPMVIRAKVAETSTKKTAVATSQSTQTIIPVASSIMQSATPSWEL